MLNILTHHKKIIIAILCLLLLLISPLLSLCLVIFYFGIANLLSKMEELWVEFILGFLVLIVGVIKFNAVLFYELLRSNLELFYAANFTLIHTHFNLFIHSGAFVILSPILVGGGIANCIMRATPKVGAPNQSNIIKENNEDAILLGTGLQDQPIYIGDSEFNQHTLVIGTTGSGKTTTLMNVVDSCAKRGLPLIYVDGKGSVKLVNRIKKICDSYNRKLKVFAVSPENIPNLTSYNPLSAGNFSIWKNKIISLVGESETRGQEHYQIKEQSYINLVCEIMYRSKRYIDLEGFLGYLKNPEELQRLANAIDPNLALRLVEETRNKEDSLDLIKVLDMFYYSSYGNLFSTMQGTSECINIKKSIEDGEIVVFLLDAASYKRDSKLLGRLIINDINAAYSEFGHAGITQKGYCVFDEFASYASPNLADILAMQRDNGLHALIGTQSINAISKESGQVQRIAVELIANCNTFIIHRINDPLDIETMSQVMGTRPQFQLNTTVQSDFGGQTSFALKEDAILDPQKIRELTMGCAWVCRLSKNLAPQKVKINYIQNT